MVQTHPRLAPGASAFPSSTNGIMPETSYHPKLTECDPSFTPRMLHVSRISRSGERKTHKVVPSGYASFLGVCHIISVEVVFLTISTGWCISFLFHTRREGAYVVHRLRGPLGNVVHLPSMSITPLPFQSQVCIGRNRFRRSDPAHWLA